MPDNYDLSVVIVNFNTKELALECLESVEKSGFKGNLEVIVVDNGSSDGSVAAIKKSKAPPSQCFGEASKSQKSKVKVIRNRENVGFARASNQGIKEAGGEFVLLLNSDTRVSKGVLDGLVDFARKNEGLGAVGPALVNKDGSLQPSAFWLPTLKRAVDEFWMRKGKWFGKYLPDQDRVSKVEALVMAAFLVPRRVFERVGVLDERYFMYFEDLDFCRRLKRTRLAVYYVPEFRVHHEEGASGKDLAERERQWMRLIPSSRVYHGDFAHWLIYLVMLIGQKWGKSK